MKVIISILAALAIFFTLAWWNQKIINETSNELFEQALKVEDAVNNENWESANNEIQKIKKMWTRHKKTWLILMDHQEVDEIDLCVYNVDQTVKNKEKLAALESITALRFHVQDSAHKERLELSNIF